MPVVGHVARLLGWQHDPEDTDAAHLPRAAGPGEAAAGATGAKAGGGQERNGGSGEKTEEEAEREFEELVAKRKRDAPVRRGAVGRAYQRLHSALTGKVWDDEEEADVGPYLRNLRSLDLSHCRLHHLPPDFGRLSALTWLKCNGRLSLQLLPS